MKEYRDKQKLKLNKKVTKEVVYYSIEPPMDSMAIYSRMPLRNKSTLSASWASGS